MKITKEEILNLCTISMIEIKDQEIPVLIEKLNSLIDYIERLKDLPKDVNIPELPHNQNIFRDDSIDQLNSQDIIKLAPKSINNYFVVPSILNKD